MKKLLIAFTAIALSLLVFTACTPAEEETPACTHANREVIPATEAASCTERPYGTGIKCADCGEIIKAPTQYGEPRGHTEKHFQGVPVTCTKNGKTPSTECSYCGEVLVPAETITALGHEYVDAPEIPATCTEAGYKGGKICKWCGTYDPENLPTMTNAALGHELNTVKEALQATCTTPGYTAETECTREGCDYATESVATPIDENNHPAESVETLTGTPASCAGEGTTGLTDGKKCNACEVTFVEQEEIPVPEHVYGETPTTEEGCEKTYTCTADGCGHQKTVAEHTWNDGDITTPATETSAGEKTYTCTVDGCSATKVEPIPATGNSDTGAGTTDPEATT